MDHLSLTVPAGEICVLVGPSGCGKTTALRMVNRMTDLTGGDILLGGRSVRDRDPDELRRDIGYVIQQIGPVPAPDAGREHGRRPAPARVAQGAHPRARRGAGRPDGARPRARRPLPRAGLGRPAPARRRRPRPGRRPAADADGRAVRGDRPDQPGAAAERVPAAPGRDPQDDRLRHPRHRRGDQDGRPRRHPAPGRRAGAVRHAGGDPHPAGRRLRRALRRRRPRAQAPLARAAVRPRAGLGQRRAHAAAAAGDDDGARRPVGHARGRRRRRARGRRRPRAGRGHPPGRRRPGQRGGDPERACSPRPSR